MCDGIPRIGGRVIVISMILVAFLALIQDSYGQKKRVTWSQSINSYTRSLNRQIQPLRTPNYYGSVNDQVQTKLKPVLFNWVDPVASMTTMELIQKYGYKGEAHRVVTADGYILTTHRILPNTTPDKFRGPIFLQHGIFTSSIEWFFNKKENLIALQLSDAGYDVWIGNARGTTYSRGHVNTSITDSEYWEFSVNEMGKYDVPAEIDYILAKTGQAKIYYIGFSMGSTTFWIMMSHHPQYNDKVKFMIALAPVVYLNHMRGPLRLLSLIADYPILKDITQLVSNGELLPYGFGPLLNLYGSKFCGFNDGLNLTSTICALFLNIGAGYTTQLDSKRIQVMIGQTPASISARTGMHLIQFMKPSIFREFDFGKVKNRKYYGKSTPPLYDLKKTTTPCALFYGPNDIVVNSVDVDRLAKELPNVVVNIPIANRYFNHLDFQFSKDQNELLNNQLLKLLEEY